MPDSNSLVVVLFIIGFLLIAAEVFVPGMILGTMGFLCLAGSVAMVYATHGIMAGVIATLIVGSLSLGGFLLWLNLFPRTFIGRRMMLMTTQPADPSLEVNESLVGASGVALTPLRPAGTARIDGKRVDVTTRSEFLEEGAEIVVVAADGMRVVVRQKDRLVPDAKAV
jgi:membrane-bound serine protease (ClpP class)